MTRVTRVTAGVLALALIGGTAAVAMAQSMPGCGDRDARAMGAEVRGPAHGQRGQKGQRGGQDGAMIRSILGAADADGDGRVTRAEIDAYRADQMAAVDASGDGALSIEEFDTLYRALTRSRMVDAFQDLDADGDGRIVAEEIDARIARIMARMDRDGDGVLSLTRRAPAAAQADN